jgi:hypothetical protein
MTNKPMSPAQWTDFRAFLKKAQAWLWTFGPGTEEDRRDLVRAIRRRAKCGSYSARTTRRGLRVFRWGLVRFGLLIPDPFQRAFIADVRDLWIKEEDANEDSWDDLDEACERNVNDPRT